MPMTLAEKIVARAAGRDRVTPGEIVTCAVDLAMIHDSGGPRRVAPILKRFGVGLWDASKVVLISDHYVPAGDDETRRIGEVTRAFAAEHKLGGFYDGEGICHVVLPERGHLKPGMFVVGGDSHSPTGGAFGAYMFGIGATEMAGVLATGEIWLSGAGDDRDRMARQVRAVRGRQGRDAVPVRPARHGRRPHPGGALPRRGDPRAADAGAHDARQHDGRARRPDRPVRSRRNDRRRSSAPPAREPADVAQLAIGRRRGAGRATSLRCVGADAAGRGAAQPRQCRAGRRPRHGQDRRRAYRRLHGREARRPAHGGIGAQGPQGRSRRIASGRARLAPRPGRRGGRRHAADPDRRRRNAPARTPAACAPATTARLRRT